MQFKNILPILIFSTLVYGAPIEIRSPATAQLDSSIDPPKRLVGYYGQNAAGGNDTQKTLSEYCSTSVYDIIVLSFMIDFNVSGTPSLNFANACEDTFPGSTLLNCPTIAKGITDCQKANKIVLLSLGGATGGYILNSEAEAVTFANTLFQMFGPVDKAYKGLRPFGSASIDGFDLDIESGVNAAHYVPLVNSLRKHYDAEPSRTYYISAAPQCARPDASLDLTLRQAFVDFVFIQFYNNKCELTNTAEFNFADWHNDRMNFRNKQAQLFIGAPGSQESAQTGYVPLSTLTNIIKDTAAQFSSFSGVMLWDISTSSDAEAIKSTLSALPNGY